MSGTIEEPPKGGSFPFSSLCALPLACVAQLQHD
jgi:hypothetical protein